MNLGKKKQEEKTEPAVPQPETPQPEIRAEKQEEEIKLRKIGVEALDTLTVEEGTDLPMTYRLFQAGQSTLSTEFMAALDIISEWLRQNPNIRVEVGGHTDNRGKEAHNIRLSAERAEAVMQYLIKKRHRPAPPDQRRLRLLKPHIHRHLRRRPRIEPKNRTEGYKLLKDGIIYFFSLPSSLSLCFSFRQ
jgi:outer membrane protein OmpA-like peptidoglycan-associated protein